MDQRPQVAHKLVCGSVVWFPFLWKAEASAGHDRGNKVRPCVVMGLFRHEDTTCVLLAPITHELQSTTRFVELREHDMIQSGLDRLQRSYLVADELNWLSVARLRKELLLNRDRRREPVGRISADTGQKASHLMQAARAEKKLRVVDINKVMAETEKEARLYRNRGRRR